MAAAKTEATNTTAGETEDTLTQTLAGNSLIKNYVVASVAASAVPVPLFDIAAVTAIQLRMIQKLSHLYGKPFSEGVVRSIIASLGGSVVGIGVGAMAASLVKFVPVIGWAASIMSLPLIAGASTYAIGQVFQKHYAEGGTAFDLKTEDVKAYYKEQFEKGKVMAAEAKAKAKETAKDTLDAAA
ncbi:MAG: DUF697 domain-containing protein [Alphaproteobacteria bacterium]|nr:DUF697 domain-containing protein [Alphaproteobacteria bacterium]MBU0797720.1 DUF697 domain-containing protein [Alphaproteobacteria bacterium]MBU0887119.1 DUF697 domain-containing protein [Alphaproteobacteria bacterium]MBU1814369.1 DUF697 domain-containing protein [Alphaproteobacteria bacterium]MBU2090293.1 DUF697 domain-containing protein [Alphaproteobacteria bacterium]